MSSGNAVNFVMSGLGGQGILFLSRVLAQAALRRGLSVMGAETHGMAQRGGSVVAHLRIGRVDGSLVRAGTARYLLALEENEAYRNLAFLARGGRLIANAVPNAFPRPEVQSYLEKAGIAFRATHASGIALRMGTPMAANLALLGFFSALGEGPFDSGEIGAAVEEASPDRFKQANMRVFEAGVGQGKHDAG